MSGSRIVRRDELASTSETAPEMDADALPPLGEMAAAYAAGTGLRETSGLEVRVVGRLQKLTKQLVEIHVRRPDGEDVALVGKRYHDEVRGARVFDLMRELWIRGLDDPQLHIARPIAYLPAWRFLLMTKAAGRTLYDWLLDEPKTLDRPRLTADWLRRLHGVEIPRALVTAGPARPEAKLERMRDELAAAFPSLRERLAAIALRLRSSEDDARFTPRLLHGDFHPQNVFVHGDRVTVIDFDHAAIGDPAWDLGYHVAQIQAASFERCGRLSELDGAAEAFVTEYIVAVDGEAGADLRRRLERYRALALFESLHYRVCILHAAGMEVAVPLASELERAIERCRGPARG